MVSSGISSMKHFLSVSPMWKYSPEVRGRRERNARRSWWDILDLLAIHILSETQHRYNILIFEYYNLIYNIIYISETLDYIDFYIIIII